MVKDNIPGENLATYNQTQKRYSDSEIDDNCIISCI